MQQNLNVYLQNHLLQVLMVIMMVYIDLLNIHNVYQLFYPDRMMDKLKYGIYRPKNVSQQLMHIRDMFEVGQWCIDIFWSYNNLHNLTLIYYFSGLCVDPVNGDSMVSVGDDCQLKQWRLPDPIVVGHRLDEPIHSIALKSVASDISHHWFKNEFATCGGDGVQIWEHERSEFRCEKKVKFLCYF